jgi:hypothetical protein
LARDIFRVPRAWIMMAPRISDTKHEPDRGPAEYLSLAFAHLCGGAHRKCFLRHGREGRHPRAVTAGHPQIVDSNGPLKKV